MSVLEQYREEAKKLYPIELQIRKINDIRKKIRAGEQLTAEQYEKALKPVTSELIKAQEIISKLTKKQETSTEKSSTPIDDFLNDAFASTVLSKYNLPLTFSTNHEARLVYLATISKQLGRQKAKSSGSEREEIDKEIDVIREYRKILKASQGTGIAYYKNAKELAHRLKILLGQIKAGNDSVDIQNEALTILDKLLQEKEISKEDHEKLYDKIYSF